jgi:exopolyphosphatase/guanosine-5'-triphosphate,3'-diphosphate pyrophosphatase
MSRITVMDVLSKEALVQAWVRRRLGGLGHETQVARLAGLLFDLTQRWHGLGKSERKLLTLAAWMHDVGRVVDDDGHEEHGAELIMNAASLPLGETERRRIAFLTRYHRGRLPEASDLEFLDERRGDEVRTLHVLLGLLRAADGLDRRSMEPPQLVVTLRGRILRICGYVEGDVETARAKYGQKKKMRLLEETLECEVRTEWLRSEAVALVA